MILKTFTHTEYVLIVGYLVNSKVFTGNMESLVRVVSFCSVIRLNVKVSNQKRQYL